MIETGSGNVECERSTVSAELETKFNGKTSEWEVVGVGAAMTFKECTTTLPSCTVNGVETKGTFEWRILYSKTPPTGKVIIGKPEIIVNVNCSGFPAACEYIGLLANKHQLFAGYYNPPASTAPTSANPSEVGVLDFSSALEELSGSLACPSTATLRATI